MNKNIKPSIEFVERSDGVRTSAEKRLPPLSTMVIGEVSGIVHVQVFSLLPPLSGSGIWATYFSPDLTPVFFPGPSIWREHCVQLCDVYPLMS